MREKALLASWGPVSRGREGKALEVFQKAHSFLQQKKKEGKIHYRMYFNSQTAELAGFMLIHGNPEVLIGSLEELELLYMEAAAVVDNLSLQILTGGEDEDIVEHLKIWTNVQKKMGFM